MKDVLVGLLMVLVVVALLVGGYYLGIIFAVLAGIVTALGIVLFLVVMVSYSVWDLFQTFKKRRRESTNKKPL